jgi:hypothetical protein
MKAVGSKNFSSELAVTFLARQFQNAGRTVEFSRLDLQKDTYDGLADAQREQVTFVTIDIGFYYIYWRYVILTERIIFLKL